MKVMHLSDLHLGKIVLEQSMIEDQRYILDQINEIIENEKIETILISGDIYDKSIPPIEAVNMLDEFITNLQNKNINILIISGNHDSKDRLGFGNKILEKNNIYIETTYSGKLKKVKIKDVNFYMLPFLKPSLVKPFFEDIESYDDAIRKIILNEDINKNEKNIILVHQFVTSNSEEVIKSDSETVSLGGIDNVDVDIFKDFDYVAMGHIHRPQKLTRDTVRYSGSILKYSFSEANYNKSVPIIDTTNFSVNLIPLKPLHDMKIIEGKLQDLLENSSNDYINAILLDDEELIDPIGELRKKYPNILKIEFKNKRSFYNENSKSMASGNVKERSPLDLFEEFYLNQNNVTLDDELRKILNDVIKEVSNETN